MKLTKNCSVFLTLFVALVKGQITELTELSNAQITQQIKENDILMTEKPDFIERSIGNTFYLDYHFYINAYSILLQEVDSHELWNEKIIGDANLENYGDSADTVKEEYNGCFAESRKINFDLKHIEQVHTKLGEVIEGEGHAVPYQEAIVMADYTIDIFNKDIYLFNTDFQVELIEFETLRETIVMVDHNKIKEAKSYSSMLDLSGIDKKQILPIVKAINVNKINYAFTPYGAVSFSSGAIGDLEFAQITAYVPRLEIYRVRQYFNRIYIASGDAGLDIYKIVDGGQLILQSTFKIGDNAFETIRDFKIDEGKRRMYIMDYLNGFYIYELNETTYEPSTADSFKIDFVGGYAFDFYQNTFVLIQEIFGTSYGMEYYIDLEADNYFLNNQFYQDLTIHDVIVEEDYGVLLSDTVHRVIYHSIYPEYINKYAKQHEYFSDPLMKQMKILRLTPDTEGVTNGLAHYDTHYLIGLRLDGISVHQLHRVPPKITCHSKREIEKKYVLSLNTTECVSKAYDFEDGIVVEKNVIDTKDVMHRCAVTHQFIVKFNDDQIDKDDAKTGALVAVLIIIFVIMMLIACLVWYKFHHKQVLARQQKQQQELQQRQEAGKRDQSSLQTKQQELERRKKMQQQQQQDSNRFGNQQTNQNDENDEFQEHQQHFKMQQQPQQDNDYEIQSNPQYLQQQQDNENDFQAQQQQQQGQTPGQDQEFEQQYEQQDFKNQQQKQQQQPQQQQQFQINNDDDDEDEQANNDGETEVESQTVQMQPLEDEEQSEQLEQFD